MEAELVTLHQLAVELKVPVHWLRHAAEAGLIPSLSVPTGQRTRFLLNKEAVRQALAKKAGVQKLTSKSGRTPWPQ
jgi:hypothetical protein